MTARSPTGARTPARARPRWAVLPVALLLLAAGLAAQGQVPGPPRNVLAAASGSTLTVSWDPPLTGGPFFFYVIDIGFQPGVYAASVPVGPLTQVSADVDDGVYYLRVSAMNAVGAGVPGPEVMVTVGSSVVLPGAPQNLKVGVTPGAVTFAWDPPVIGLPVTGYVLSGGTLPGTSDVFRLPLGNVTTATFPISAAPAQTFFVQVAAVNTAGEGPPGNAVSVTLASTAPAAPRRLIGSVANGALTLTWSPPPAGVPVVDYVVHISNQPRTTLFRAAATGPSFSMPLGSTPPGHYYFRVAARNSAGEGPSSNEVRLVYGGDLPPDPPQNVTATLANGVVSLAWVTPFEDRPILGYSVRISSHPAGGGILIGSPAGTSFTVPFSGATPGLYYFLVSARNAFGEGLPASDSVAIGQGAPPLPPTGLLADVVGDTLSLYWNPSFSTVPPVTSSTLHVGSTPGASDLLRIPLGGDVNGFTASIAGVTPGFYYFRVTATNLFGEGPPSNEVGLALGGYCAPPPAPALTGSSSGGTVTLMWTTPPGGPVTGYELLVAQGQGPFQPFATVGPINVISGAATPGTYRVRVVALAACGRGAESNTVTVTVP